MKMRFEKRKIVETMLITLFPILLYGILGPLEIYAGNTDEFIFILKDFFYIFLMFSIVLWFITSFILLLLPERISKSLQVGIFTFSFLSYLQNMFLNKQLMNVNGSAMDWDNMHGLMLSNLIVWIVVAGICLILPFVFREKCRKIYVGVSAFLSAVQFVAIISLLIQVIPIHYSQKSLSGENQFVVAPNDNIIVFVVDSWYNTQFEQTLAENQDFEDVLKDFTYYNNADSHYNYTFPSLPHMLTGVPYDCNVTQDVWKESCWHEPSSENFYLTLHSLGYECDFYTGGTINYLVGDPAKLDGIYDNVSEMEPRIRTNLLIRLMEKMAIYKYVPYVLKPFFEVQTYVMEEAAFWDGNSVAYNNELFYQRLIEEGISIDEELDNKFDVIHINGLHEPWIIHADVSVSEIETEKEEVSAGLAVIITKYIEQLKTLGGGYIR